MSLTPKANRPSLLEFLINCSGVSLVSYGMLVLSVLSEVVMHCGLIFLYNMYTLSKNYSNIDHRGKETLEDELIVFLDWLTELN